MVREQVLHYIDSHQDEAVGFLRDLLKINSSVIEHGLDGQEEEAQLFLKKYMENFGASSYMCEPTYERIANYKEYSPGHSYKGRPNLVCTFPGSSGGRSIILNGHVDTMAPADLERWTYDPYSATVEDGTIYSVGACDMKAGLCALVFALKAIKENANLKGTVYVQSVVDEEGGGNGTLDLVAQGVKADAAIVGEPTDLTIQTASRGVLLTHVKVKGKAIHACIKWSGVNAIDKALLIKNALEQLEHKWLATKCHPTLPRPTVTLGKIEGGVAGSAVPGECDMYFDVKYLPYEYDLDGNKRKVSGDKIKEEIINTIHKTAQSDEWLCEHMPEIDFYQHCEPHDVGTDFELVKLFMKNQKEAVLSGFPAGCDARHLEKTGIRTIVYGPGHIRDAHGVDEKVRIEDYMQAIRTNALTIMDWCGVEEV